MPARKKKYSHLKNNIYNNNTTAKKSRTPSFNEEYSQSIGILNDDEVASSSKTECEE